MATDKCKCGEPHDGWPGEDGGMLCQTCWETEVYAAWWRMVKVMSEVNLEEVSE